MKNVIHFIRLLGGVWLWGVAWRGVAWIHTLPCRLHTYSSSVPFDVMIRLGKGCIHECGGTQMYSRKGLPTYNYGTYVRGSLHHPSPSLPVPLVLESGISCNIPSTISFYRQCNQLVTFRMWWFLFRLSISNAESRIIHLDFEVKFGLFLTGRQWTPNHSFRTRV